MFFIFILHIHKFITLINTYTEIDIIEAQDACQGVTPRSTSDNKQTTRATETPCEYRNDNLQNSGGVGASFMGKLG